MPGAPNKPPETAAPPPPPPSESPAERATRRLAPGRVALRLPIWKGAPSRELTQPLEEAEAKLSAGDLEGANSALDRLATRFAEPRWPSLPEPFRALRVSVPVPQPPSWDPEHALSAAEKEGRRFRRYAESQLGLARASVAAEAARGTPVDDLSPSVTEAEAALARGEVGPSFWGPIDRIWGALRERVPMPAAGPPKAAAPGPAEAVGA
jgi:hypothetical protein